jgi:serine protease inhibitor
MRWPFPGNLAKVLNSETTVSSSHSKFAFRLFRELSRSDEIANVFLSPPSVMLCLALVHQLASGETRESIAKALEIAGLDQAGIELEIASLKSAFSARTGAELSLANALFIGRDAQIATTLQTQLRSLYDAELSALDFADPDAVKTINAWVAAKTKGKIPQIVSQLSPLTAMVALNAVYFKSGWVKPFIKDLTQPKPFASASGIVKQVPMMWQQGTYLYYEDKHVQVAALPYRGNLSMYIVLPVAEANMKVFRQNLTSEFWESWLLRASSTPGTIFLPRFRVDYAAELNNALKALGMERAFDRERAQFDHVLTDTPPVWLDQVRHRAVAEVNEEGTEAAAATFAMMATLSAVRLSKKFQMIVDRPFVAVIRDESTKAILFIGWIGDPK